MFELYFGIRLFIAYIFVAIVVTYLIYLVIHEVINSFKNKLLVKNRFTYKKGLGGSWAYEFRARYTNEKGNITIIADKVYCKSFKELKIWISKNK